MEFCGLTPGLSLYLQGEAAEIRDEGSALEPREGSRPWRGHRVPRATRLRELRSQGARGGARIEASALGGSRLLGQQWPCRGVARAVWAIRNSPKRLAQRPWA